MREPQHASTPKPINVALQGGGAHGAFTWGVLDRLLEDDRVVIEALSGSSAGAMNAAVLAEGLVEGGKPRARAQLAEFWRNVSSEALLSPIRRSAWDVMSANWNLANNPFLAAFDAFTRTISPYQFNPLNLNPLRRFLGDAIDFSRVQACTSVRVFVAATNVETGAARVFAGHELTLDALMASACLPYLYQAVEIDGVPYWDGGFAGNPPLRPFLDNCDSSDVLLVQINPIHRPGTPTGAREIFDRMNEISFNAPLLRELEFVEFVNRALRRGDLADLGYREIFLHRIGGEGPLGDYGAASKLNGEWSFLERLRDLGRHAATDWLDAHVDDLGRRSTLDPQAMSAPA
jgi:NTE family protein